MSCSWALFSTWVTPTIMIQRGEAWDDADPIVTSHPDWFTKEPEKYGFVKGSASAPQVPAVPPPPKVQKPATVEEATAQPGVPRGRTRAVRP